MMVLVFAADGSAKYHDCNLLRFYITDADDYAQTYHGNNRARSTADERYAPWAHIVGREAHEPWMLPACPNLRERLLELTTLFSTGRQK